MRQQRVAQHASVIACVNALDDVVKLGRPRMALEAPVSGRRRAFSNATTRAPAGLTQLITAIPSHGLSTEDECARQWARADRYGIATHSAVRSPAHAPQPVARNTAHHHVKLMPTRRSMLAALSWAACVSHCLAVVRDANVCSVGDGSLVAVRQERARSASGACGLDEPGSAGKNALDRPCPLSLPRRDGRQPASDEASWFWGHLTALLGGQCVSQRSGGCFGW